MLRKFVLSLTAAGLCAVMAGSAKADNRASITKKGSLLVYSKVEIKWERSELLGNWVLSQDTVLDISNDYPADVKVQFYFVNGDEPTEAECNPQCVILGLCDSPEFAEVCIIERAHPGWNWVDCEIPLTANQPTYMSLVTGQPAGCQPFTELDPGDPPGRPDPDNPEGRVLRGFVYAWAVKNDVNDGQNVQIRWNHLSGDAAIINYRLATSAEYNAYAFQAIEGTTAHGDFVGTAGIINLDGVEYDAPYRRMLMDFYTSNTDRGFDFDITLHAVSADLRQETEGPVKTKAVYEIWNEDERRFSETIICVECWNQTLASNYPFPNNLLQSVIHTNKGKARITGTAHSGASCPLAIDAPLLGLQIKHFIFGPAPIGGDDIEVPGRGGFARSAISMVGQGEDVAVVKYDIIPGSEEAQGVTGGSLGTAAPVKAGRAGR